MKPLKNQNHTPGNHEINVKKTKTGFFSVFLFYFFVAFEFAYMAGPFAVYFYSVYSPVLNFLNEVPVLSTLIRFFLPHVVRETASPFINGIETAGILFSVLGFSIFVIGACQIYYIKLTKKGAVLGGLYKYIRHPQYTSFIVCSFGLMLLWPRYIVIFFFVTLSFGYFFLARAEEKECEQKFGDSYIEYEKRTGRFFPKLTHHQIPASDATSKRSLPQILISYLLTLALFYLAAFGLNRLTIASLYAIYDTNHAAIALCSLSDEKIAQVEEIAKRDPVVQNFLSANSDSEKELNYVLPTEWFAAEIPMNGIEYRSGHKSPKDYDTSKYKIIFTRPLGRSSGDLDGKQLLTDTKALLPLVEVWVDIEKQEVIEVKEMPETVKYAGIPEAIF